MEPSKFSYESMGTKWEITIWGKFEDGKMERWKDQIIKDSQNFDQTYSRFKKDSLVWSIADSGAGTYEVQEDFMNMLKLYMDLYKPSDKKLNPLIGFSISDLGYDHTYSLTPKEEIRSVPDLLDTVEILEEKMEKSKNGKIKINESVLFDFGALGKGYFVDKIADYLKAEKLERFLVNGSGDVYYYDKQNNSPLPTGLEDPDDPSKVIGKVDMCTGAMCASGINRRKWPHFAKASRCESKMINHVIDPHTLQSQEELVATWVTAPSCAMADALATCLFFSAPENFSGFTFDYLIMNNLRQVKKSEGLNSELY